jgi:hypothetical protein
LANSLDEAGQHFADFGEFLLADPEFAMRNQRCIRSKLELVLDLCRRGESDLQKFDEVLVAPPRVAPSAMLVGIERTARRTWSPFANSKCLTAVG